MLTGKPVTWLLRCVHSASRFVDCFSLVRSTVAPHCRRSEHMEQTVGRRPQFRHEERLKELELKGRTFKRRGCFDECFPTTNEHGPCLQIQVKLYCGSYRVEIERKNPWHCGFQYASLLLTRKGWIASDEKNELHTRLPCPTILTVLDDYETAVINVFHQYNWFGTATGEIRVSCRATQEVDRLDFRPRSLIARFMSWMGGSESSRGNALQSHVVQQQTPLQEALVRVVASNGNWLNHWAAFVEFKDGQCFSCELTAIELHNGSRFGRIRPMFQRQDGFTDFCNKHEYAPLEHQPLKVETSPAELFWLCKTNPYNAKKYDITGANCQRWLQVTFCKGFDIQKHVFPEPVADKVIAGALVFAILILVAPDILQHFVVIDLCEPSDGLPLMKFASDTAANIVAFLALDAKGTQRRQSSAALVWP